MKKYLLGINEETLEYKIETIEDINNEFEDKQITYGDGYTFITCDKKDDIERYKRLLAIKMLKDTYNELQEAYRDVARLNKLYIGLNEII